MKDQGKFGEAVDAYKKSILISPNYAKAYCNMGIAPKNQGKLDEALDALTNLYHFKPDYLKLIVI